MAKFNFFKKPHISPDKKRLAATLPPALLAVLTFFLCFSGFVYRRDNLRHLEDMRELTQFTERMSGSLSNAFAYADIIELAVQLRDGDYPQEEFNALADMAMRQNDCIDCIQLAPGAVVTYIDPLEGNEAALGHELLLDEDRKAAVLEAMNSDTLISQGPVQSLQGKTMIFGRKAIRVDGEFWGLAIIAVDFDQLLESCGAPPEQLRRVCSIQLHEDDGTFTPVWGDGAVTENQVLYTDIHLPGQPLRIFVQREQSIREDLLELTPYLIISLLLALAIYVVARYHLHKVHMSRTDQLTQTLNRAEFQRQVQRHLRQKDRGFALLIMDLDNFKDINDTYGHLVGDTILVETAERMKRAVRGSDLISRVGGDEFMILLLGLTEQNALNAFLKRLREIVEQDVPMGESLCLHGGLSVGYALYPREGQDFDTLYQTADQRMYEDKARRKAGR